MKFILKVLPAALLIGMASASAAPDDSVRAEAAAAFGSGDFASAVQLYAKSRKAAAERGDRQAWAEDTATMARAYLRMKQPERARQLLAEETAHALSPYACGTLEGEILVAEGKVKAAKEFFRKLAADIAASREFRGEAELALAALQLASNEPDEHAEALKTLERLEKEKRFAADARLRRIYALIRCDRAKEALELAKSTKTDAAAAPRLELLRLLALLRTGAADDFDAGWKVLRGKLTPRPDDLAFRTLELAAELAAKASRPERAALYWGDAYGFADDDAVRRDLLRKRFNCCAAFDARQAAQVARRYMESFPDDTDDAQRAERAALLIAAGRLLGKAGDHRGALEFFKLVADDGRMSIRDRRDAARDAALSAEKLAEYDTAKIYFVLLISTAQGAENQQAEQLLYAEYLIRSKDYAGAEQMLRDSSKWTEKDRAGRLLILALSKQKKFEAALARADELRLSAVPENAGFGEFQGALMAEQLGRAKEARERYLKYASNHPRGEFIRPARLAAAKLAEATGDYASAAKEFYDYGKELRDDRDAAAGALFRAVRAGAMARDRESSGAAFEELKRVAGVGREYYAAALQILDSLRLSGEGEAGLKFLESLDRSKCTDPEKAMLDLMRAKLLVSCGRRDEAIKAAELLLSTHLGVPAEADAAFLAGTLYLGKGAPEQALPLLLRPHERRPVGGFGEAVSARIAECRLELYKTGGSQQELQAAAEGFERLADGATMPEIRLMCKYKLGWCRERLNDPRAAYGAYHQALLYAKTLKDARRAFDPKWCSRSAYAALNLLLTHRWPNADQMGAAIITLARSLELPGGNAEFDAVQNEFNERFLNR